MRWQVLKNHSEANFKRLVGVKRETYEKMVSEVKRINSLQAQKQTGKKRGPKVKLTWYDKVLMMLMYYLEYRTFAHIAADYNISEAQCWRIVTTLERWLIKSELFHLPGRKKLTESDVEWDVVLVDVSEHPIERPKKKQKHYYSGKKKKHSLKSQLVVDKKTGTIICTKVGKGRRHDFHLFKTSKLGVKGSTKIIADSGYQGIKKTHSNSELPKSNTKKHPLTEEEKAMNHQISSERVLIENVIRKVKIFRIIAEKYRN